MADSDAVLRANDAFYAAFAAADMKAMADIWAHEEPVAVIHPGTLAVVGREPVLESWREILASAASVDIVCADPQVQLLGDVAVVLCQERIGGHMLAASNTFRRTGGGWFLVLHQAGPVAADMAPVQSSVVH